VFQLHRTNDRRPELYGPLCEPLSKGAGQEKKKVG